MTYVAMGLLLSFFNWNPDDGFELFRSSSAGIAEIDFMVTASSAQIDVIIVFQNVFFHHLHGSRFCVIGALVEALDA